MGCHFDHCIVGLSVCRLFYCWSFPTLGLWHTRVHCTRGYSATGLWQASRLVGYGSHTVWVSGGLCALFWRHTRRTVWSSCQWWVPMPKLCLGISSHYFNTFWHLTCSFRPAKYLTQIYILRWYHLARWGWCFASGCPGLDNTFAETKSYWTTWDR